MKTINLKKILIDKALVIVLLFMIIGIIIIEPSFLQWRVFTDIITQSAETSAQGHKSSLPQIA